MSEVSPHAISFAEIVKGRNADVRITSDGLLYAVDLVMVMTGKNCNNSNECLRDLNPSLFNREKFLIRSRSRLVTFENAIELIMVLPGKIAKQQKKLFADIIIRYLDGDTSLCNEVVSNKELGRWKSCEKFVKNTLKANPVKKCFPEVSYVYATQSQAFPGLLKIGKSCNVAKRVSTLNTGCAPSPHVVVALAPTFNPDRDESLAHTFYNSVREEGEFFRVTQEEVKDFFQAHITSQYHTDLAMHIAAVQTEGWAL